MDIFQRTETIICAITVKDSDGVARDPATSTKITIKDPGGTKVVDDVAMNNPTTGSFDHDYTPGAAALLGVYEIEYIATNGTRITIQGDSFELVARTTA